jgi:hypothetical protein
MGLRNGGRLTFDAWRGLDTYTPKTNVDPQTWFDSNNVLVSAGGEAEPLRSPKAFGNPIPLYSSPSSSPSSSASSSPTSEDSSDDPLIGLSEYRRAAGHALIIDKGDDTYYLLVAGGTPTPIRSGQAGDKWTSVTINNTFHRIDGNEFIQILPNLSTVYRNGIDPPVLAPTISYVADDSSDSISDDSGEYTSGVQVSYAYRNSTTGHVSRPSPLSDRLGPTALLNTLRIATVVSTQAGVDQIVFFLTTDGGHVPYLLIDCDGDMVTTTNATGNFDIPISEILLDTLTPEPIYNYVPPVDQDFMFEWKDRLILCKGNRIRYSGFEAVYIGRPWESWPILNEINIPNRGDVCVGGVGTNVGALVFGQKDSYLLSGYPSDKTSGPNNAMAITEHLEPMKWNIGIGDAETAVYTNFGAIWVDQTGRIRLWPLAGFPIDMAPGLRNEIDSMTGPLKATWFQHGKNGGYYVLTDGTKTLFVMLYKTGEKEEVQFGYGRSDIAIDAMTSITFAKERFFYGKDDQIYELLDPDLEGDGWAVGTEIFFKQMVGNEGNFSYAHSMQLEGNLNGLTVEFSKVTKNTVTNELVESDIEEIILEQDLDTGGSFYGIVDRYGRRHVITYTFDIDDTVRRVIEDFQLFIQNKQRLI